MEVRRMRLDTVMPGQSCVLREIELPATQRARLEELGLLPGTQIRCLYAAGVPHGAGHLRRMRSAAPSLRCGGKMRRRS